MDGWMKGLMYGWMDECVDGGVDGWMDGGVQVGCWGERGEGRASRAAAAATSPLPDGVSE